ncbi:MAG: ABC transporter permease [Rhodospirillaceae bacterium]|nr:ABC transporter permease [Rhodospirillaceae bacterium]
MTAALPTAESILQARQQMFRRVGRHVGLMLGGGVFFAIVAIALLAPLIAPADPYVQNVAGRLISPVWEADGGWANIFGTDHLGRDYLTRLIYGARISLLIGVCAALISGLIGTTLGVAAGYFGGRVDTVITTIITIRLSLPVVLVALAVVGVIGGSLQVMIAVIGLLLWDRFAVVMRSATMQIRSLDYVAAARVSGCSTLRIVLTEVLPNVLNPLIVVATLEMAHAILLEAALSFLGLGVQPPLPSWGLMIAEGKNYILFKSWLIGVPGVALFALILAINLMGDGVRDITAPEGRG